MEEAKLPSGGTLTNILKNMESCGFIRKYNSLSLRKTQALGISGIDSEEYTWRKDSNETGGAQIDLLIDRKDNTINLCEMKFCESVYELREDEEMKLRNRISALRSSLKKKTKSIQLTMITSFGVAKGKHSGIVQSQVTLDDLFAS